MQISKFQSALVFFSDSFQLASTADLFLDLDFILAKATTAKKLIANLYETNLLQSSLMKMVNKISLIHWEKPWNTAALRNLQDSGWLRSGQRALQGSRVEKHLPVPLPSPIHRSPWTQQPTPQYSHKLQASLCMNGGTERQADVRFQLKLQTLT